MRCFPSEYKKSIPLSVIYEDEQTRKKLIQRGCQKKKTDFVVVSWWIELLSIPLGTPGVSFRMRPRSHKFSWVRFTNRFQCRETIYHSVAPRLDNSHLTCGFRRKFKHVACESGRDRMEDKLNKWYTLWFSYNDLDCCKWIWIYIVIIWTFVFMRREHFFTRKRDEHSSIKLCSF